MAAEAAGGVESIAAGASVFVGIVAGEAGEIFCPLETAAGEKANRLETNSAF
jgi:hypothetical protein